MKIKILKCSKDIYWYKSNIGDTFEVKDSICMLDGLNYRLKSGQLILEKDTQIIDDFDPSPTIKIKIIKCSDPLIKQDGPRWYRKYVGEVFEVAWDHYYIPMYDVAQYILPDGRCIAMQDVEEIKETKMKVVEKNVCNEMEYPCLKQGIRGGIVLFFKPKTGVVMTSGDFEKPIGHYSTSWCEENFKAYKGTLEISNGD